MKYKDCNVIYRLEKSETPLSSIVECDEFTKMVENNFDYDFDGKVDFYPYLLPKNFNAKDYQVIVICGSSGSGKSTILKNFEGGGKNQKIYDDTKAIVSNFNTPEEASLRLSSVGLNSMPTWCKKRSVLSIGEGFRADLALNIESNVVFDEFTSTIDRNVAKSTCKSIKRYIDKQRLEGVVFCSCHNDYIPFLKPNIVIDVDDACIYDCGDGELLGEKLPFEYTNQTKKILGGYLGSIII